MAICNFDLKHNRLVQFAALRTARAVHVRVVGVDEAAFRAAENRGPPSAPARNGGGASPNKSTDRSSAPSSKRHINHNERGCGHLRRCGGRLVAVSGTVCQLKIISPNSQPRRRRKPQAAGEFERALVGSVILAGGFQTVFRRQQNGGNDIARRVHQHLHDARRNHVVVGQRRQIDFVEQSPSARVRLRFAAWNFARARVQLAATARLIPASV